MRKLSPGAAMNRPHGRAGKETAGLRTDFLASVLEKTHHQVKASAEGPALLTRPPHSDPVQPYARRAWPSLWREKQ